MYAVTNFYKFFRCPEPMALKEPIENFCNIYSLRGLFILSPEGCNATLAGSVQGIEATKVFLDAQPGFNPLTFKDSKCERQPFKRLSVVIREEIITAGFALEGSPEDDTYLTPSAWQKFLETTKDITLLDVRNDYEVKLGTFEGAINPKIKHFTDLPQRVDELNLPKERPVLMFCTGGVRCEKAALQLKQAGFKDVYQLRGGILKYIEELPHTNFHGECFVFDNRVALTQELKPSTRYRLCPHCGDPGEKRIACAICGKEQVVCDNCLNEPEKRTCSKNCAYHVRRKSGAYSDRLSTLSR